MQERLEGLNQGQMDEQAFLKYSWVSSYQAKRRRGGNEIEDEDNSTLHFLL